MIFREAVIADIPQLSAVRLSVNENKLSNPGLITQKDYEEYLMVRGKGWVYEINVKIVGFAIVDYIYNNVWALFVCPEYEGQGIGKRLHTIMLNWYFSKTDKTIWLSTWPGTRAERFYRSLNWRDCGKYNNEIKFELSYNEWNNIKSI